jgi:hypothetical protein
MSTASKCRSPRDTPPHEGLLYDLNTRLTFIVSLFMIFRLCFFSCYNMVAKFLLSRLCLLCSCFKFFDPSTQCLL